MITLKQKVRMFRKDFSGMQRDYNRLVRDVLEKTGVQLAKRVIPLKFKEGSYARFGYPKPGREYLEMKQRALGHTRPMVFTGELESHLRAHRFAPRARVTSKKARVKIPVPTPHPINPRYAGYLGALRGVDLDFAATFATNLLRRRLNALIVANRAA